MLITVDYLYSAHIRRPRTSVTTEVVNVREQVMIDIPVIAEADAPIVMLAPTDHFNDDNQTRQPIRHYDGKMWDPIVKSDRSALVPIAIEDVPELLGADTSSDKWGRAYANINSPDISKVISSDLEKEKQSIIDDSLCCIIIGETPYRITTEPYYVLKRDGRDYVRVELSRNPKPTSSNIWNANEFHEMLEYARTTNDGELSEYTMSRIEDVRLEVVTPELVQFDAIGLAVVRHAEGLIDSLTKRSENWLRIASSGTTDAFLAARDMLTETKEDDSMYPHLTSAITQLCDELDHIGLDNLYIHDIRRDVARQEAAWLKEAQDILDLGSLAFGG